MGWRQSDVDVTSTENLHLGTYIAIEFTVEKKIATFYTRYNESKILKSFLLTGRIFQAKLNEWKRFASKLLF